jgi:hypothetical protein
VEELARRNERLIWYLVTVALFGYGALVGVWMLRPAPIFGLICLAGSGGAGIWQLVNGGPHSIVVEDGRLSGDGGLTWLDLDKLVRVKAPATGRANHLVLGDGTTTVWILLLQLYRSRPLQLALRAAYDQAVTSGRVEDSRTVREVLNRRRA